MTRDARYLVPYLLRQVRVGLIATAMVVGGIALAYFVLDHEDANALGLALVLGAAVAGGAIIGLLPWRRLLQGPRGMHLLYAWSAADILLISAAVAATGGARSDLFLLYSLTTFFFVASYPPAAQAFLFAFTVASYSTVLWLSDWGITVGGFAARVSILGILAYLGSHLSRELHARAGAEAAAREEATARAAMLSQVAEAGRDMALDPNQVVDVAVEAVARLGFPSAAFVGLDEEGNPSAVPAARGSFADALHDDGPLARTVDDVRRLGASVTVDAAPGAAGEGTVVASPVWVDGWMAAVLAAGSADAASHPGLGGEAVELIATHAGFALENASRHEEQRRTVERLEEADRLKTDFVTTVSHELRTPLTTILGNAATLERAWSGLDDDTRADLLARLASNARALEGRIAELLDFSRSASQELAERTFGPVDLSMLLRAAAEQFVEPLAGHQLEVDIGPGLVTHGDAGLLSRVVLSLLSNAATHTPPGTTVTLAAQPDPPTDIVVSVADDGPGIRESDLPFLGDGFYRGGEVNLRPGGFGLGLAKANEILRLHGTELEIRSAEGEGAMFRFRLPDLREGPPSDARDGSGLGRAIAR
jgi:signal transduction histidine kinase